MTVFSDNDEEFDDRFDGIYWIGEDQISNKSEE